MNLNCSEIWKCKVDCDLYSLPAFLQSMYCSVTYMHHLRERQARVKRYTNRWDLKAIPCKTPLKALLTHYSLLILAIF